MIKKQKDVELIPFDNQASGWKVKHDGKEGNSPSGPKKYPDVVLDEDSGPHLIVFRIPKSQNATFKEDDPIWIHEGTTSPQSKGVDDQIPAVAVSEDGKMLVLLDLNSEKVDLSYRIEAKGFDKVLDPIIRNGGTSRSQPPAYSVGEIVSAGVALFAAVLLGIFVQRKFLA